MHRSSNPETCCRYARQLTHLPSDIAIAHGATLRSMDKNNGAPRKCRSSLGIPMNEPYDKNFAPHKNAEAVPDKFENKKYVRDCLDWIFKLVSLIIYYGSGNEY
jgi:hypothetical protein